MQEKILRSAPIDIAIVKAMHLTWKMKVRSALNGASDWREVHADSPEKSDIGKWIQSVGIWKYQNEPIFEMFVKQHRLTHEVALKIQQLALAGKNEEARLLLAELDKISDDFLKLIDAYKVVLEAYKEQVGS
ncbi:MAG: hypothetical protein NZM06_02730 [Chloroherpetonaceae bacterium]|nr:hypothetical protein [Chloroherpetonaceae bacterium]MDW8436599.1 hypothetical protein [Chloroherpetonaceae bacterium]